MKAIIPLLATIAFASAATAADYHVTNPGGNLEDAGTFTPSGVPGENDTIIFDNTSVPWVFFNTDHTYDAFKIDGYAGHGLTLVARSHKLTVNNDLTMNTNGSQVTSFGDNSGKNDGFSQIVIKGDFVSVNDIQLKTCFYGGGDYSESNPSMIVGGAALFNTVGTGDLRWAMNAYNGDKGWLPAVIQLGGLSSANVNGKNLILCNNDSGRDTTLLFKNYGSTAFTGGDSTVTLTSWYSSSEGYINIVMDNTSNKNAQTLRVKRHGTDTNEERDITQNSTVTVRNGVLNMYSDTKFKSTEITGDGTLGIAGLTSADDRAGSFITGELLLNGGNIVFDVGRTANDSITADSITGDSTGIILDLNPDEFAVGDSIDLDLELFKIAAAVDLSGTKVTIMLGGVEQTDLSHIWNNGSINISGTIIPEPSAIAAIFGAAALALAAYRRRR